MSKKDLIERLVDIAFRELQHDTGPQDREYVHSRKVLRSDFYRELIGWTKPESAARRISNKG